jgi:hypothetical protein
VETAARVIITPQTPDTGRVVPLDTIAPTVPVEVPIMRRVANSLSTLSEILDPTALQKMLPATRERRRHFAKYVKGVLALCIGICILAGVSAFVGGSSDAGLAKAALLRTRSIAMIERNGLAHQDLVRGSITDSARSAAGHASHNSR